MIKKFMFFLSSLFLFSFFDCSTMNALKYGRTIDINNKANFETEISVADTDVSGNATVVRFLGFIKFGGSKVADNVIYSSSNDKSLLSSLFFPFSFFKFDDSNTAKNAAALNACEKAKCDVLMAPRYIVNTTNFIIFKVTSAKVVARPGKIGSINQIKTIK